MKQPPSLLLTKTVGLINGIKIMKKHLWIINLIFLVINILLFLYFTANTIIGSKPFGDFITDEDIELQLIISLIYEFVYFAISVIISKVLKKDLSYKGPDVLELVPKSIIWVVSIISITIIIYAFVFKVSGDFIIMCIAMLTSFLIQYGILRYLKKKTK